VLAVSRSAAPLGTHLDWDLADLDGLAERVATLGNVDVLVNNAGVMHAPNVFDYCAELEANTLAINLQAPLRLMSLLGRRMAERGVGRIVNVASIAGQIGHPDVWYGATKAGLLNATKSFAAHLGPRGVQVTAVAPGPVETEMLESIPAERLASVRDRAYSGRFSRAGEIADTVVWLATDAPATLNGACIDVNDGAALR